MQYTKVIAFVAERVAKNLNAMNYIDQNLKYLVISEILNIKIYLNTVKLNLYKGLSCINMLEHGNITFKNCNWFTFVKGFRRVNSYDPRLQQDTILLGIYVQTKGDMIVT